MHYFGADEQTTLARYSFFIETGLIWKTGYRQFCLVKDGRITPFGRTIAKVRHNFREFQADAPAEPSRPTEPPPILIRTVRDVGDAYCEWLHDHKKSPESVRDTIRAFADLIARPECGDLPLGEVDKAYFLRWRNYCHDTVRSGKRQPTWSNKRTAFVKAAFNRCDKENWIPIPW